MSLGMKNEHGNGDERKPCKVRCNTKKLATRVVKPFLKENVEMKTF